QRLLRRQADGFTHRLLGPVDVAPAQLRQATDVSGSVIDLFVGQSVCGVFRLWILVGTWCRRWVWLPGQATDLHRRRSTQVGAWRHGSDMAGIENIGPGTGSAGTAGGDETGHWHGAGEDRLDNRSHRGVQPA